ncbi:MAG: MFS transporter [Pseudomonadota bacterium]
MTSQDRLFSKEFIILSAMVVIGQSNVALFFQFPEYLSGLGIDKKWFGFLIGVFSFSVIIIRPLISPLLRPQNAIRWIILGAYSLMAVLVLYDLAGGLWTMTAIRVLHGAAYVVLATATFALAVAYIPAAKSGQAFGILTVLGVIPFAVVPPLVSPLWALLGGFDRVLDVFALINGSVLILCTLLPAPASPESAHDHQRISFLEVRENLKDPRINRLLLLSLLLWTAYAPAFYFLDGYGRILEIPNPGWFFTLCTGTEIAIRLLAGSLFDRFSKPYQLAASFALLTLCFIGLAYAPRGPLFYTLGIAFGLGWGIGMPVLTSLVFDVSLPKFKAMNTNLAMVMFQLGFLVGPIMGSVALAQWSYRGVFLICAVLNACAVLTTMLSFKGRRA